MTQVPATSPKSVYGLPPERPTRISHVPGGSDAGKVMVRVWLDSPAVQLAEVAKATLSLV